MRHFLPPTFPLLHRTDSSRVIYYVAPSLLWSPALNVNSISRCCCPNEELSMEPEKLSCASSCHNEEPSMKPVKSSCASSLTLVESITSTLSIPRKSNRSYTSLSQLPTHLLFRITAYLDIVSKICLQNTNHHFRDITLVDRAELNVCARFLLDQRFGQAKKSKTTSMQTCFLCKTSQGQKHYSAKHIRHLGKPQQEANKWITRTLENFPWLRRYSALELNKKDLYHMVFGARPKCYEHLMEQFATSPAVEALMPYVVTRNKPKWLAFAILRCMHCGKSISEGDTRLEGCLDCQCDFCPRSPELQFHRCGPDEANRPRPRQIFKSIPGGETYVVEGSGKGRITVPICRPFHRATRMCLQDLQMCYVNEARAVRPQDLGKVRQVGINNIRDSQGRLEEEILRLLDGLGKVT